jgi:hypothetical protein
MVCLSGDKVCISLRPRSGVFDSAGSRLARVFASARCCLPCCLTPSAPRNTRFRSSIPSLQIPLSNASRAALRLPSHGSGPGWFAIPSLYDSFIRYSMPVYPGAIQTWGSAPRLPPHTNLPHYLGGTRSDISRTIPCSFPLNFSRNSGLAIRASRSSAPSGAMLFNSCRMACRRSGGC